MFTFVNFPSWISPYVVSFLPVRWYALMYIVAFTIAYFIMLQQCTKEGALDHMNSDNLLTLITYLIVGLILGARLVSCLLYEGNAYYWLHPWMIFWPFRNGKFIGLPGMSYHGGVIGAAIAALIYSKKTGFKFGDIADLVLIAVPLGYTFGRLGNFINGELWGRCTGTSFGMIFPNAPEFSTTLEWVRQTADKAGLSYKIGETVNLPRHPSQLYEALFEGIILFFIIYFVIRPWRNKKKYGPGFITGFYFVGYGLFRFIIEYFREPDSQLGFIIALGKETEPTALFKSLLNISMGQILCFGMIVIGIIAILRSVKRPMTSFNKRRTK